VPRVSVKARLREKGFVAGPFVEVGSPALVEILGLAGFDFAIMDCEHAALSGDAVGQLIRAAEAAGIAPLVRIRHNQPGAFLEALDLGAVGLHVPQIASPEDALRAVRASKFPPLGARGFNPFVRAAHYGAAAVEDFRRAADQDTLLVLHIEALESLSNIDQILAVPGFDVAFLGPYDLSQALGLPGEVTHPRVREAMRAIVRAAQPHGVAVGCFANDPDQARLWLGEGVSYLAYSIDSVIFLEACRRARESIADLRRTTARND
jgi:4-hydroxy-2-oxoheptanedioate aldolase